MILCHTEQCEVNVTSGCTIHGYTSGMIGTHMSVLWWDINSVASKCFHWAGHIDASPHWLLLHRVKSQISVPQSEKSDVISLFFFGVSGDCSTTKQIHASSLYIDITTWTQGKTPKRFSITQLIQDNWIVQHPTQSKRFKTPKYTTMKI